MSNLLVELDVKAGENIKETSKAYATIEEEVDALTHQDATKALNNTVCFLPLEV